MEYSIVCEFDHQITCLEQLTRITESLKEKCVKLEKEKNDALKKCETMKDKLERLINKKCTNCSFLKNELQKERKEREQLKKAEKTKLLQTIARTLESLEDGNSNHVNQLLTELNFGRLAESSEQKDKNGINLIEDKESNEGEDVSKVLVNETMMVDEEKGVSYAFKGCPIIIPETEVMECSSHKSDQKVFQDINLPNLNKRDPIHSKENNVSPKNKDVTEQASKKLILSPILSSEKVSPPRGVKRANHSSHSPSVLSEIIEAAGGPTPGCLNEKDVEWKMKPGMLVENVPTSTAGGKRMKQMTLSVSRTEKKHDITLSDNFRGGVARHSDEEDIVHPSPEQNARKLFVKKTTGGQTLEDPDMTVFNPVVTSTCLPVPGETSFDRIPETQKSPKYKYRRDALRKRHERMRLPGQDCDQCVKYYEAAGLDRTQELRERLNRCSRHRDKHQLRANTPPGFWDPVLPMTPDC